MSTSTPAKTEFATVGAGCFWGVQHLFEKHLRSKGLIQTQVGFTQGNLANPSYQQVCTGTTNHNEVCRLEFDPSNLSYEQILHLFFRMHDPTTINRQGADMGTQYRSGIYYYSEEQKRCAEKVKAEVQKYFKAPICTEIEPIKQFWTAEDYHQMYLEENPNGYQCASHYLREFKQVLN